MHKLLIILLILVIPTQLKANNLILKNNLIGEANLKYYIWNVYDAKLYSIGEFSFDKPFALSLIYNREFQGNKIADRSIKEMQKIGLKDKKKISKWQEQMRDIFPDVDKGNVISGIYKPNEPTIFLKDKKEIGTIEDPDFGKWFFGIWLDEKTSEPEFRTKLLGK